VSARIFTFAMAGHNLARLSKLLAAWQGENKLGEHE
jgi:hypothetical protein